MKYFKIFLKTNSDCSAIIVILHLKCIILLEGMFEKKQQED